MTTQSLFEVDRVVNVKKMVVRFEQLGELKKLLSLLILSSKRKLDNSTGFNHNRGYGEVDLKIFTELHSEKKKSL